MARLGEMLRLEKIVTSKELELALELHVLHGVKLGTCLVEMGYVADEDLARCLGQKTGNAFLSKDQLLAFGAQNLAVISATAIKKYRIIPVGINSRALLIATDNDFPPKKQLELETFLGRKYELVTVSGYAVDCFFEEYFGMQRPGRFLPKYSKKKAPERVIKAKEKVIGDAAQIIIDGIEWKSLSEVTQSEESAQLDDTIFSTPLMREEAPPSLSDAAEQLNHAKSRDDIAKTVLDYLMHSSENVALFIVIDGIVRGWKACSKQKKVPEFEAFFASIDKLPDLQQCVVTKKPYFTNSMTKKLKLLLHKPPYSVGRSAFFPIFVKQRVIAVLLCDESEKLNPNEITELCRKASYALEILILRSKLLSR